MTVLAHVGVKDEIDLLPRCIEHLFAIGVDRVIATDMGSTDGSLEWLQQAGQRLPLVLQRMNDRDPDSLQHWCDRVLAAVRAEGADWTLFLDADEFPLPRSGRLKDCQSMHDADILVLDRFNVPLGPQGPRFPPALDPAHFAQIPLLVKPIPDFHDHLAAGGDTPWIRGVPGPKVLARTALIGKLAIGGHDVEPVAGSRARRLRPNDLLIAHLPFTSRTRFRNKVANLAEAIAANQDLFAGRIGWHWQRWLRQWRAGELDAEYERQVFDDTTLAALSAEGVVTSAADWFSSHPSSEARP